MSDNGAAAAVDRPWDAVPDGMWQGSLDDLDRHYEAAAADLQQPQADQQAEPGCDQPLEVAAGTGDAASAVEPYCTSVEQWVSQVLAPTYPRRATAQFRWCAQWWRHPEAVSRLQALWRSWEALRPDPLLGMATWLRDHLDAQLPVLCGPAGPFADCDPTRHFDTPQPSLALAPVPNGWWDDPELL